MQASVALKRIDKFMNNDELKSEVEVIKSDSSKTNGHAVDPAGDVAAANVIKTENAVEIIDATFQWEPNQVSSVIQKQLA